MWPFEKKSARRQEIRRSIAGRQPTRYQSLRTHLRPGLLVVTLAAAVACALILNAGGEVLDIQVGQRVPRAIASRCDFEIPNGQLTTAKRLRARDTAPNHYDLNVSLLNDIRGRLASALTLARSHANDPNRLRQEAASVKINLDDDGLEELQRIAAQPDAGEYTRIIDLVIRALANQPWVQPEPKELAGIRTPLKAVLHGEVDDKPLTVDTTELLLSTEADSTQRVAEIATRGVPFKLRPSFRQSIAAMLLGKEGQSVTPLYLYDSTRSSAAAQEAYDAVPTQYVRYATGDILANAGEIASEERQRLASEHDAFYASRGRTAGPLAAGRDAANVEVPPVTPQWVGRGMLAVLVVFGLAGYLLRYRQGTFDNVLQLAVMVGVFLLLLSVARLTFVGTGVPHIAVAMQALAAAVLAIVFPRGSVLAVCGALALLNTLATQQDIGFLITLLAVSATLVIGLREVRRRGRIVGVGTIAASVAFVTTLASLLIDGQALEFCLRQAFWTEGRLPGAAVTTLAAAFLIEGLLPGIERFFGVSTSLTLLEWGDPGKPLMRIMAAEAPGTYNHSLLVGALAGEAAEAIGANALMARTGAYYHDIGKINKPEYFIENQDTRFNRHERLSPAMSLLIIIAHVKDGIEMAKEYGIPRGLHPFIAEHHGTTLVEYFYHAATKARKPSDPAIADTQFRYPGPKPQSRETAIVMLCDGVEGAVRAMPEPTPARIEETVGEIVRKRMMDGQFDECDMTFRELEMIERRLVKSLCGIYHARIAYPGGEAEDEPKRTVPAGTRPRRHVGA